MSVGSEVRLLPLILDADHNPTEGGSSPEAKTHEQPDDAQKIHIYKKTDLKVLKQKCPSIRYFCDGALDLRQSESLRSAMTRLLAPFEGGQEILRREFSKMDGFDNKRFEAEIQAGGTPGESGLTCSALRQTEHANCPFDGCISPLGTEVKTPLALLKWGELDVNAVLPGILAKSVIDSEFGGKVYLVGNGIYAPNGAPTKEISPLEIKKRIQAHTGIAVKPSTIKRAYEMIRYQATIWDDSQRPDSNLICFENGVFNVQLGQMESHRPDRVFINQIPHCYVPGAACERFAQFLTEIWGQDPDFDAKVQFLRQWMGYLLVADSSLDTAVIFAGFGANGKSVLMETMQAMLGEKNAAHAMLGRLGKSFVRSTMQHKLANFSADLPLRNSIPDGELKAIISGNGIEASAKFEPSESFRPYVRLVVSTNHLPKSKDQSEGYFRRWVILQFNQSFTEAGRDPNLLRSLLPELPGIIAWAVQGLIELRSRQRFDIPPSSVMALQNYRLELSPVRMFADECLVRTEDRSGTRISDLFAFFRQWCQRRGFDVSCSISLGRELSTLGFTKRKSGTTFWHVKVSAKWETGLDAPGVSPASEQLQVEAEMVVAVEPTTADYQTLGLGGIGEIVNLPN